MRIGVHIAGPTCWELGALKCHLWCLFGHQGGSSTRKHLEKTKVKRFSPEGLRLIFQGPFKPCLFGSLKSGFSSPRTPLSVFLATENNRFFRKAAYPHQVVSR